MIRGAFRCFVSGAIAVALLPPAACSRSDIEKLIEVLATVITVPVRWCAVAGSPQAQGRPGGQRVPAGKMFDSMRDANYIMLGGARLLFVPAPAPGGIPVVADPDPDLFAPGDITVGGFAGEFSSAVYACRQAWQSRYPGQPGIIAINARVVIGDSSTTGGAATGASPSLWVKSDNPFTGRRGDDLCGSPRHLTVDDVLYMAELVVFDPDMYEQQPYIGNKALRPDIVFAHEIGHTLTLGHGNGFDDNHDGVAVPQPGPRRYDQFCDVLGEDEDDLTRWTGCETSSLMNNYGCTDIRPLQAEQLRAAASLEPGARGGVEQVNAGTALTASHWCAPPCRAVPPGALRAVSIAQHPSRHQLAFTQTLTPSTGAAQPRSYLLAVDSDANLGTGCDTRPLLSASAAGVDVVVQATVPLNRDAAATAIAWVCTSGAFVKHSGPEVAAVTQQQFVADSGRENTTRSETITVRVPDSLVGKLSRDMRVQAFSGQPGAAAATSEMLAIDMRPPAPSTCSVEPKAVQPGKPATVTAGPFTAGHALQVFVGDRLVGSTTMTPGGTARVRFTVPRDLPHGLAAVEVRDAAGSTAQSCAVAVRKS